MGIAGFQESGVGNRESEMQNACESELQVEDGGIQISEWRRPSVVVRVGRGEETRAQLAVDRLGTDGDVSGFCVLWIFSFGACEFEGFENPRGCPAYEREKSDR